MTAQYFTGNYGHRRTFLIAAGGFMIGMLIMAISGSLRQLMVGRALVGLAVGTGLAIDPMYIAEITPSEHRGRLVSWTEIATNIGLLLGFSTSLFFAGWPDETQWRAMFAVGMIPPACLILAVVFIMPESPRWLVSKNRLEESKRVLEMIYPQDHDVDQIVETIRVTMHKENNMNHAIGWKMFLRPSPSMARMLMVGLTILVMQQACGIDAILYYLMDVFAQAGITSSLYQSLMLIFLGFIKLIFVFVASFYFDRKGRRSVLFVSLSGMALSLLLVSFSFFFESSWTPALSITGLALYLAFFSSGLGPGAWLVPSEVFANSIRAKAMSVGTFLNRATATVLASTFLSLANAISWGGFFLLLCGLCLATLLFLFIYLPETKGRTLEEMTKLFAEITGDDTILVAERTVEAEEEEEEMQTPVSYETSDPVVDQVRQID
jgi:sugar porter (SP) family MFS transporter